MINIGDREINSVNVDISNRIQNFLIFMVLIRDGRVAGFILGNSRQIGVFLTSLTGYQTAAKQDEQGWQ